MNYLKGEYNIIDANSTKTDTENKLRNWYAIYTNPRAEKKVFERLVEAGIEVFLPLETKIRVWSDRKKKVKIPYIKSYVFVRIEEIDIYKKVLKVFGVRYVLQHMGKPAIVKEYEINNLKILSENEANVTLLTSDINIEVGEFVELERGSFKGLKGRCVKINGRKSIMLEMEAFESFHIVEVAIKYLDC